MSTTQRSAVRRAIAQVLDEDTSIVVKASKDATFIDLGGDSVKATQLTFKLAELGTEIEVTKILDDVSLQELVEECVSLGPRDENHNEKGNGKRHSRKISKVSNRSLNQNLAFSLVPGDLDAALSSAEQQTGCSRSTIEDLVPCTPAQASLWASSLRAPGTYITQWVWQLRKVEPEHFQRAWEQVLDVTPILRSRFIHTAEEPYMLAILAKRPSWETITGSLESFQNEPFPEMQYGSPLVYLSLLRGQDGHVYFRLIMHHSLYDLWSFDRLILRDLQHLVHANGSLISRPSIYNILEPPTDTLRKSMESFWRANLDRTAFRNFPEKPSESFSPRTTSTITREFKVPSKHQSTIAAIATAAWSLVLGKYHQADAVGFGITTWGRDPSIKDALEIAFPTFNTVPFQQSLAPEQTIADLVADVQATLNQYAQNQRLGLAAIAKLSPSAAQACQFSNVLLVQPDLKESHSNNESPVLSSQNLISRRLNQATGLIVECTASGGIMKLRAGYDDRLLSGEAAKSTLEHWEKCFHQIFNNSKSKIAELEIKKISSSPPSGTNPVMNDYTPPDSEDIAAILRFNSKLENCPRSTMYDIFSSKAKEFPDAPCLLWQGQRITYAQLKNKSNELAAKILDLIEEAPGCVVTCFEKGIDAIVSMLAIMRVRKTYVPIDPTYPISRKANICEQTDAQAILTSSSLASQFTDMKDSYPLLLVESNKTIKSSKGSNELGPYPNPDSVAYVIFTSGSTGTPKGVVIEHKTFAHILRDQSRLWGWDKSSHIIQFSSYTFDASLLEIFGCFQMGAMLCIPSEADRIERLSDFMNETDVTDAMLTPPAASMIQPQNQTQLRTLITGGEALSASLVKCWEEAPNVRLTGLYGPTEASAVTITNQCLKQSAPNVIGKPVACRAFVVDEAMRLLPLGHRGELILSGPLARGYLKDEKKTNEKFVHVSFAELPSLGRLRVYKTGDIVSLNNDGDITFHGRNDAQIKIGGRRIELGEIETQLTRVSGVTDGCVAVVLQATEHSKPELACFFVPSRGLPHAARTYLQILALNKGYQSVIKELRSAAVKELPKHMVPAIFVPISQIPATIQGKTNRKALEQVYKDLTQLQASVFRWEEVQQHSNPSSRPLSANENLLKDAWATVLSRSPDSIALENTFNSVGGDSIAAVRLSTYLSRLGIQLSVQAIYEYPTLTEMATMLSDVENLQSKDDEIVPFELLSGATQVDSKPYVIEAAKSYNIGSDLIEDAFPTPRLQGFQVDSHIASGDPRLFCGRFAFELFETVTNETLQNGLQELYKRTPNLRTRIIRTGEKNFNIVLKEESCNLTYFKSMDEFKSKEMGRITGYGEPVSRCSLVYEGSKRYFFLTLLHALYDGWGMNLILSDLTKAFQGRSALANMPSRPPYSVFVRWFQKWPKDAAKAFWGPYLSKIGTASAIPRVALDPAKPLQTSGRVQEILKLDTAIASNLSIPALLHASMAVTCYKIYSATNPAFLTASLGRRDLNVPGAATMTGPLLTAVPVAVEMQPERTAEEIIRECHDHLTQVIPYEHLGMVLLGQMRPGLAQWLPLLNVTQSDTMVDRHDEFMRFAPEMTTRGKIPRTLYVGAVIRKESILIHVLYDDRVVDEAAGKSFLDEFMKATRRIFADVHVTVGDLLR